jgi:ribose transport system substrate-binding protein
LISLALVVRAFSAVNRPTPLIIEGNREDELRWWSQQARERGYDTISISSTPGVAAIAFWVAYQVLQGAKVPNTVQVPLLEITRKDLNAWMDATPATGVATPQYSLVWTKKLIDANLHHMPLPSVPLPGQSS